MALCILSSFQHHQDKEILTHDRSADVHTVSSCFLKILAQVQVVMFTENFLSVLLGQCRRVSNKRSQISPVGIQALPSNVGIRASPYGDTAHAHALPMCLRMASVPPREGQQGSERFLASCVCPEVIDRASLFHQMPYNITFTNKMLYFSVT